MGKFFDILASGMNLDSRRNRVVSRKGGTPVVPRHLERSKRPLQKLPNASNPPVASSVPPIRPISSSTASPIPNGTNLDRAWSISSSIIAVSTSDAFKRPETYPSKPRKQKHIISASDTNINLERRRSIFKRNRDNVTLRKGQNQASSSKSTAVPSVSLRGASSISSLDSKHKIAPINPLKSGSKDKLDKIGRGGDRRKDDKSSAVTHANNNQKEVAVGALKELDVVHRELDEMAREKAALALELSSHKTELVTLRSEIARLKMYQDQASAQMDQLTEENTSLRCRLRDVVHSPLSDNEKQQLLDDHRQQSSSAPASIATGLINYQSSFGGGAATPNSDIMGGGDTTCTTPEWDKQSSASEMSVACLQDRIMQMQETHYSTNEELQATLQELSDLQSQLTELQGENERLSEEKTVLLESLCRQTERLEDSRVQADTLKQLLYKDRDGGGDKESSTEREQKLVDLLKNAQEERELLLLKQEELNIELQDCRQLNGAQLGDMSRLSDRLKLLESTLDATHADRKQIDQELSQVRELSSGRQIEISRLSTLLDNARAKIDELEQDRALSDKSELDELLDNARKEKDSLESQAASLQEQLSLSQCEIARLKEQISILQEECKVTRNNAKCTQSELEYKCDQLRQENTNLSTEVQGLQEAYSELQVQAQCHLEDKRQLKALLSETQRHLGDAEGKLQEVQEELEVEKKNRQEENSEWEQFQNDLLMTVRVANDFKTEAQQELQQLVLENKMQKDKVRQLEQQLDKLKAQQVKAPPAPAIRQTSVSSDTQQSVLSSMQQEIAVRRQKIGLSRQDSRLSVKSLIESIENASKQAKVGPESRSSSNSSLNSIASENPSIMGPSSVPALTPTSPMRPEWGDVIPTNQKCPLREQTSNSNGNKGINRSGSKNILTDSFAKPSTIGKSDDNIRESIFHSAKGLDFSRRNSYSDLSERKDPLNALVKNGGSKRNALLKWCQNKTVGYRNIDITNFSSSWNDGLALCALLHTYLPERVPYDSMMPLEKRRNFSVAFSAAESVGIQTTLNINDMVQLERPDWQQVMSYVTAIYKHFET